MPKGQYKRIPRHQFSAPKPTPAPRKRKRITVEVAPLPAPVLPPELVIVTDPTAPLAGPLGAAIRRLYGKSEVLRQQLMDVNAAIDQLGEIYEADQAVEIELLRASQNAELVKEEQP